MNNEVEKEMKKEENELVKRSGKRNTRIITTENNERKINRSIKDKNKRNNKSSNNKIKKILKVLGIIILSLFILACLMIKINDYIILDKNEETNLIINNNNVTANMKKDIIIENGIIYLSKSDIANYFDEYIYEEEENNKIITTYRKKIAEIGYSDNNIVINGSNKEIDACLKIVNDEIYLPISEMLDVYEIEIEYIESSDTVTIDSTHNELVKAIITKDVAVKSSTNLISKTLDRVETGEYVVVISKTDEYAKIRTDEGKIGYIKLNIIANEIAIRDDMEDELQIEGTVNLTWDYFSEYATASSEDLEYLEGVNVLSPAFFYIDEDGEFNENVGDEGIEYIQEAKEYGYRIWAMVSNSGTGMLEVTSEIMNSYEKRQELIEDILNACITYNLDGINIDFENMKAEDIDLFSRFIIELTPRMKEAGLVTSVDVTAPDGAETWSLCYDRNVIGDVADYIIFMAYDQYGTSSTTAGTTAGYTWIKTSLEKFLVTEVIDPQKIILAIPFYTRVWTEDDSGELIKTATVSIKNIESVIPSDAQKTWDETCKQYYVEYEADGYIKKMWIEDETSIKEKLSLITSNNLAGVASWTKNMVDDDMFEIINEYFNSNQSNQEDSILKD